jgi:hypothetical protein
VNDDQLEREIRAALLRDHPGPMSGRLVRRVDAIPATISRTGHLYFARRFALVAAVAAVVLGGSIIVGVGARPQVLPAPAVTATSSVAPSIAPTTPRPSVGTPSVPPASPAGSADWSGLSWSPQTVLAGAFSVDSVVMYAGSFYALGSTASGQALWRSADGSAWTRVAIGGPAAHELVNAKSIWGAVAMPSVLVAWGAIGENDCTGKTGSQVCGPPPLMVWTSADGVAWSRISDPVFAGASIDAMAVGRTGIVAVGDTGWNRPAIWTSADGLTWHTATLHAVTFAGAHFRTIKASGSGYVVGGSTGDAEPQSGGVSPPSIGKAAAWWSTDGASWLTAAVSQSSVVGAAILDIEVAKDGMVAVGSTATSKGGAAWRSADGRTWQPRGQPDLSINESIVTPSGSIVGDGTHLLTVDYSANAIDYWVSSDGSTWAKLGAAGATDSMPRDSADQARPTLWFDDAALVDETLVAIGTRSDALGGCGIWLARPQP